MPPSGILYGRRALQLSAAAGGTVLDVATCLIRHHGPDRDKALYATLARSVARFGPASIKLAQLLATPSRHPARRAVRRALRLLGGSGRGHHATRAAASPPTAPGQCTRATFSELELVGRGSIAYVFHATFPSGAERALKVLKPGVADEIHADMTIARKLAALMQRVPAARGIPVKEMADQLCYAIEGQTDLSAEAQKSGRCARPWNPSHVRVPKPTWRNSTPDLLSMAVAAGVGGELDHHAPRPRRPCAIDPDAVPDGPSMSTCTWTPRSKRMPSS